MTDKCTRPEGHRWLVALDRTAYCMQLECTAVLSSGEIQAMLNSHASLTEKVGTAFWVGHTCGRVYGKKAINKKHLEYCGEQIAALLESDEEKTKKVGYFCLGIKSYCNRTCGGARYQQKRAKRHFAWWR